MASKSTSGSALPILLFEQQEDWAAWLNEQHIASPGLWLRIAKKEAALESINYAEALDVALCYGWIDGQKQSYDDSSWLQKFTPRRAQSIWSKVNRENAQRLIDRNEMKPAGLREVERAREDGRWDAAYDSQSRATIPEDFMVELDKQSEVKDFFLSLNSKNRYAILHRIQTAKKPATRAKRIRQFVEMLIKKEMLYP